MRRKNKARHIATLVQDGKFGEGTTLIVSSPPGGVTIGAKKIVSGGLFILVLLSAASHLHRSWERVRILTLGFMVLIPTG